MPQQSLPGQVGADLEKERQERQERMRQERQERQQARLAEWHKREEQRKQAIQEEIAKQRAEEAKEELRKAEPGIARFQNLDLGDKVVADFVPAPEDPEDSDRGAKRFRRLDLD